MDQESSIVMNVKLTIKQLKDVINEAIRPKQARIDMLTDGMSGSGGFFRVFLADGQHLDIDTREADSAMLEGDPEPLINLVNGTAQQHGISQVSDAEVADAMGLSKTMSLDNWANAIREMAG